MATGATLPGSPSRRFSWNAATILTLVLASVVAVRFIWHYAVPYFLHFNQKQFDYYWPHRIRLVTHIGGGILALVCGTLQLWTGLRQRAMNAHRWIGRVYLASAAVGIVGAFLMAVYSAPRSFGIGLMGLATAWIVTTGIAWAAIVRGRVALHKEWMLRSYIVAFAFVTFRIFTDLLPGVTKHLGSSAEDASTSVAWISWVLPLAVFEIILQTRKLIRNPA
jgi:uncharacterized membrane protein YozB (DUF420 family)